MSSNLSLRLVVWPYQCGLRFLDILLVSAGIQLVLLVPLMVYFHRVVLLTAFLNMLVLPLVGVIIPLGLSYLVCASVLPRTFWLLGWICCFLTECLLSLNGFFSEISWLSYRMSQPAPGWIVTYYLSLILWLSVRTCRPLRLLGACLVLVSLSALLSGGLRLQPDSQQLGLTFLDVRQGDSILARWPAGQAVLVDGGGSWAGTSPKSGHPLTTFDVGEEVVSPFLWSQGIHSLEAVALTHPHRDHMGGLDSVLHNFEVKELWIGRRPVQGDLLGLLKRAADLKVRLRAFQAGDQLSLDGARIEFLNPGCDPSSLSVNNDSLVIKLKFGRRSFLLTGDIEGEAEACLAAQGPAVQADVLKVAHHGSDTSTTSLFLERVNPVIAVISVAKHNSFGHPHPEVLRRLQEYPLHLFRTDQQGAVTILSDGHLLRASTFVGDLNPPRQWF